MQEHRKQREKRDTTDISSRGDELHLIFDDSDAPAMILLKEGIEQGGLAGTQEASDDLRKETVNIPPIMQGIFQL